MIATWGREAFDLELGRLAVLPGMPGDSDAYWEALKDIPEPVFVAAVSHAIRTRKWFPVPVELRVDADAVRPRSTYQAPPQRKPVTETTFTFANRWGGKDITVTVTDAIQYECDACSDTGWEAVWCGPPAPSRKPWHESAVCTRVGVHPSHEWVRKCACWDTNTVLIRKREAQATYAAQREEKR